MFLLKFVLIIASLGLYYFSNVIYRMKFNLVYTVIGNNKPNLNHLVYIVYNTSNRIPIWKVNLIY